MQATSRRWFTFPEEPSAGSPRIEIDLSFVHGVVIEQCQSWNDETKKFVGEDRYEVCLSCLGRVQVVWINGETLAKLRAALELP